MHLFQVLCCEACEATCRCGNFSILDQSNWIKLIYLFILVELIFAVIPHSPEHKDVDCVKKQTTRHPSLQAGMCCLVFRDPCWVDQRRISG